MADTTTTFLALTKPENLAAAGAGLWGPKLNTDFDLIDAVAARPQQTLNSPSSAGATTTLDLSLSRAFNFTVGNATAVAFSNVPASGIVVKLQVMITNGGAFALTWAAAVTWLSGLPGFKVAGVDVVDLITRDGGTSWYAAMRGYIPVTQRNMTTVGTGAATIETTLHTLAVPAGSMGLTGALRVTCLYTMTGTNNTKTLKVKYGGTQLGTIFCTAPQQAGGSLEVVIANINAANVQYADGFCNGPGSVFVSTGASAGAVNSAVAQDVTITGTTPNAGDEVTVKATVVEIIPGL